MLERESVPIAAGRSPHGERGLKCSRARRNGRSRPRRSPHGERGLKLLRLCERVVVGGVALLMESVD